MTRELAGEEFLALLLRRQQGPRCSFSNHYFKPAVTISLGKFILMCSRMQEGSHKLRPKSLQPNSLSSTLGPKGRVEEQGKHMRTFLLNNPLALAIGSSEAATPAALYVTALNAVFCIFFLFETPRHFSIH